MTSSAPRLPPLPREEWTEAARDIFGFWDEGARETGGRSNLLRTLAHHPPLAHAFLRFGDHLLFRSTLPDRLREIATLRIAWLHRAEHEWAWHVLYAREVGLTNDDLAAIKTGPAAEGWHGLDRAVLEAIDQLKAGGRIGDDTWRVLAAGLGRRPLMDLIFTIGHYVTLACATASFGIEMEEIEGVDVPRDFGLPDAGSHRLGYRPSRNPG